MNKIKNVVKKFFFVDVFALQSKSIGYKQIVRNKTMTKNAFRRFCKLHQLNHK